MNTAYPDKAYIENSFSGAACQYDRYADHHRLIAERLMDIVPADTDVISILEIGCGTGILTGKLLNRFPGATVNALDISPDMIRRCRLKLHYSDRISFLVADAEEYCTEENRFDLIVSSCSLQWFHERQRFTDSIFPMLSDEGKCLMAIPIVGMLHELEESCSRGAGMNMPRLQLDTEDKWMRRFESSGFDIRLSTAESVECTYSHPLEVLKAIRGIGACIQQGAAYLRPGDMKKMAEYYCRHFEMGSSGKVTSTYRVLYILAEKL